MANLTQTAANVAVGSVNTKITEVPLQAGEALTQGQPAYYKASDRKWYRGDANTSAETAGSNRPVVIVLTPAATNGHFVGAQSGLVNLGATLAVGTPYVISATTGAICPYADLVTGDYVTFLGVATTTSLIDFKPEYTGVQKP